MERSVIQNLRVNNEGEEKKWREMQGKESLKSEGAVRRESVMNSVTRIQNQAIRRL